MYYIMEPEVSGELGPKTIIDVRPFPPVVSGLHFIFKGWLGDDIIECFPIFMTSERLKNKLITSSLSGFSVDKCEIEISEQMKEIQPGTLVPDFFWLKISGQYEKDDFFLNTDLKLCISENAYKLISTFNILNCDLSSKA
jgi:hypothetical protein